MSIEKTTAGGNDWLVEWGISPIAPRRASNKVVEYALRKLKINNHELYRQWRSWEELLHSMSVKEIASLLVAADGERSRLLGNKDSDALIQLLNEKDFFTWWTETITDFTTSINDRTLTSGDYDKIMDAIEQYWGILPNTRKRDFDYMAGYWDTQFPLILSATTWKHYSVGDDTQRAEFLEDYVGKQYYTSRSWMSGAWYVLAGKRSLLYLPTARKWQKSVTFRGKTRTNWLQIVAWRDRDVVDDTYPITIVDYSLDGQEVDYVFLDPNDVQGVFDVVQSWGALPSSFQRFDQYVDSYYTASWEKKDIVISYLAENKYDNKILSDIYVSSWKLEKASQELVKTWSEFDRVVGIYRSGDSFVGKWRLWVAQQMFGEEHPLDEYRGNFDADIDVWPWGRLIKDFYEKNDLQIRWWSFLDKHVAYRENRDASWSYTVMVEVPFASLWLSSWAECLIQDLRFGDQNANDYNYAQWRFWEFIYQKLKFPASNHSHQDDHKSPSRELAVWNSPYWVVFAQTFIPHSNTSLYDALTEEVRIIRENKYQTIKKHYENQLHYAFTQAKAKAKDWLPYTQWWETHWNMLYTVFGDSVFLWYLDDVAWLLPELSHNRSWEVSSDTIDFEMIISKDDFDKQWLDHWHRHMQRSTRNKALRIYASRLNYIND
jgi:hypothetical protein